uniref:Uncharacterized protein n=1 Tax=Candidatus Kentrum sp. LPFa TaxID=2126335 RepID=A0A450X5A2_9GAMM|nr:MAG: hypothetical protein BECKLPF1236C_GA0070990_100142 [Candidatus Kentron sp. LPFa]
MHMTPMSLARDIETPQDPKRRNMPTITVESDQCQRPDTVRLYIVYFPLS